MSDTPDARLLDRIIFWILGTALYLVIGVVPPILAATFSADSTIRMVMYGGPLVLVSLVWAASTFVFRQPASRA